MPTPNYKKLNHFFKKETLGLKKFIKKDPRFFLFLLVTIALAIFFRTYNYQGRVHFQADNAQDIQIARFAADNFKLPLAGPFSSAGPFFYGPWYFWFLEVASFLPFGFLTHWYLLTFIHLVFVVLIFYLGYQVGGKWVGAFSALFAAISPAQIDSSLTVWNPAIIPILSLLVLIFLLKFYKERKAIDLFLLSALVGLSITIHFQSLLIIPAILAAIILIRPPAKNYLKHLLLLGLGFLTAFIPSIYLDSQINWYNAKSLFIFLAIDQFNSWVPNRWLTYVFGYWPETWANIIGGSVWVASLLICVIFIFTLVALPKIRKNASFFLIALTFLGEVILYRYYRGPRFHYYSFFTHAPIFVMSGWGVFQLYKFKKVLGVFLLLVVFVFTSRVSADSFKDKGLSLGKLQTVKEQIYSQYPGKSFDIYGCRANASSVSYPMALLMYNDKRDDTEGVKIGVCEGGSKVSWEELTALSDEKGIAWYERSTKIVYYDTAEWWKKSPPSKNDHFLEFLKKNLSPGCYPHC